MDYKKEFLKSGLNNLCDRYKAVATLSICSCANDDYESVISQHNILENIFTQIINLIKKSCPKSLVEKSKNLDIDNLPEYLKNLETVLMYRQILSLKYTELKTENTKESLILSKMAVEFNPFEELSYIGIAQTLLKDKKYPEVIRICEFLKTISETAPLWEILGDTYRALKDYGLAIEAYRKYLELNENDKNCMQKLKETYEEALA